MKRNDHSLPTSLDPQGRSMWGIHHLLARLPRLPGDSENDLVHYLGDEHAVREVLTRYCYLYDGGALDELMTLFHAECVVVNPRGTYVGREAIRQNYVHLIGSTVRFHYPTNVLVRFDQKRLNSWMTSYTFSVSSDRGATVGTYIHHLVRLKGAWVFREIRITNNFRLALTPAGDSVGAQHPPKPTNSETSAMWIGADWLR